MLFQRENENHYGVVLSVIVTIIPIGVMVNAVWVSGGRGGRHEIVRLQNQVDALMSQLGLLDQQVQELKGRSHQPCTGITPTSTNWIGYPFGGMYVDVDTSACGFEPQPKYFTSTTGKAKHCRLTGATSIYFDDHDSFRIYMSTDSVTAAQAKENSYQWRIQWVAFPDNTD